MVQEHFKVNFVTRRLCVSISYSLIMYIEWDCKKSWETVFLLFKQYDYFFFIFFAFSFLKDLHNFLWQEVWGQKRKRKWKLMKFGIDSDFSFSIANLLLTHNFWFNDYMSQGIQFLQKLVFCRSVLATCFA